MKLHRLAVATAIVTLLGHAAFAQGLPPVKVTGTIAAVTATELDIAGADGTVTKLSLTDKSFISTTETISIDQIKPGSFVGSAARPADPGGNLKGIELHVFPESMRGAGAGFTPWDDGPDSSMTNGEVAQIVGTSNHTITVTYPSGQQTIDLPAGTPVVSFMPADRSALVVGAHTVVRGAAGADGIVVAGWVDVGKGDSVPAI